MIAKPFDAIVAEDIHALVASHEREDRTLEFKRELPGLKDSDRKEFLSDVSSFANAAGGDLIYGVAEKGSRADRAVGVRIASPEAELLRLDHMIRDGIRPRIIGARLRAIDGFSEGPVILIRVPRSLYGPHIISYQQDFRFYSRTPAGKFRMDVSDIRDAVLNSSTIAERVRALRVERVGRVAAGETPVRLNGGRLVVAHVVPHVSVITGTPLELKGVFRDGAAGLSPLHGGGHSGPRFNLDGIYTEAGGGRSYLQLYRNGVIESVDAAMLESEAARHFRGAGGMDDVPAGLPSTAFALALFRFLEGSLRLYETLAVGFPLTLLMSLTGVRGLAMYVSYRVQGYTGIAPFDRDAVLLPELVLEERPADIKSALRPVLDTLWQAAGAERCFDYDEAGCWVGN